MPRGVKGSGKAAAKAAGTLSSVRTTAARVEFDDALEDGIAGGADRSTDHIPRCRIVGCGAMLAPGGSCPACTFRAKKYAKVFEVQNPNCECGAPRRPKTPNARSMPRRCPLCRKLRARAKAKGLEV